MEVTGAKLAHSMKLQAQNLGAEIITEEITKFELKQPVKKITTLKNTYEAKAVILAMGATPKKLSLIHIWRYTPGMRWTTGPNGNAG